MKSHAVPLHTGDALAGVVQAAQTPPHSLRPASQLTPHAPAVQVAEPLSMPGHASQRSPQLAGVSLATQRWPQACWPVGHSHVPPLHAAPTGQSAATRQPATHVRVTGSHDVPGPHQPATTQSCGSTWQTPRLHTSPLAHAPPQRPQSCTLESVSTHRPPHSVSAPAQVLVLPPPPAPPPVPPPAPPPVLGTVQ